MDHRLFRICDTCQQLLGTELQHGYSTPQRCRCDLPKDETVWDGFDYNEHLHLCRCCRGRALRSGSRWSVWFCEPCVKRVRRFNNACGRVVIPVGRHSLMSSIGVRGAELCEAEGDEVDRLVDRFAEQLLALFDSMTRLEKVAARRTIAMRSALGYGRHDRPRLDRWLERAGEVAIRDPQLGADAAFRSLVDGMTEPMRVRGSE